VGRQNGKGGFARRSARLQARTCKSMTMKWVENEVDPVGVAKVAGFPSRQLFTVKLNIKLWFEQLSAP